jgi:hypothetical protein
MLLVPADDYYVWISVGMGLHHATAGAAEALHVWAEWSQGSSKYPGQKAIEDKWSGFDNGHEDGNLGAGTIFHLAKQHGWVMPSAAVRLWDEAQPVPGTTGAVYLETLALGHLIECAELRFCAACPHPTGPRLPALVAAVRTLDGTVGGIHRSYLRADGRGLAAIEPQRAALGPVRGGAIRLASLEDALAAGELVVGIDLEEAASLGRLLRRPAWAAAMAANLATGIRLPAEIRRVVIANVGGDGAPRSAWFRLRGEGRAVRTATPNGNSAGFNEILRGRETP